MTNKKAIKVLENIEHYLITHTNESCEEEHMAISLAIKALYVLELLSKMKKAPTVTPDLAQVLAYECGKEKARPQGKKDIRKPYGWQFCSECGKVLEPQDKFCWFCGADMRKETEK